MIRLTSEQLKKDAGILEDAIAFVFDCARDDQEKMQELIKVNGFTPLGYGSMRPFGARSGYRFMCKYVHNDRLYWLTNSVVEDAQKKKAEAAKKEILTKDGAPNGWVSDFFKLRGND